MVLDAENIWEKFLLYSREEFETEGTERENLCRMLCAECGEEAAARVRDEGRAESFRGALESLAAAEAFFQLTLADDALEPESLSLPEVKWTKGSRGERAGKLAEEKRKACAAILEDADFFFGKA